ncbi:MAG: 2-polyprenyl-3-methyl-6-methoxy-1,4-benzoquinone monooxygenase [Pseudomonadota bacterium]|nr:2-polyprenyl-3-methyl-6-methoxy-1,4-benzoquinone monooxygenase [Pseudomonadota bacterium]
MKNSNKPLLDKVIMEFEYALESIFNDRNIITKEKNTVSKSNLTKGDSDKSIKVMRVNHMGEVCAQALYRGQAIVTKDVKIKNKLYKMCNEENNHLQLCNLRLRELNGKPSLLNPAWYAASFILGVIAGANEKKWKLGFIEETEKQVVQHLESSIASLPKKDLRSRKFLKEIAIDEEKHRASAKKIGSVDIPENVKRTMDGLSSIMKKISFYI